MARALAAVGAALVFLLLVLGAVVYLNRDEDAIAVDNLLAESITREIGTAEQRGADVHLADVTDFEWDRVLLAARTATHGDVERALGRDWKGDLAFRTATHEDVERALGREWKGDLAFRTGDLLIFVRDGHVARFADYRGEGRFEGVERPVASFDRDAAVFSVRSLVIRPRRRPAASSP